MTLIQSLAIGLTVHVHEADVELRPGDILFINTNQLTSLYSNDAENSFRLLNFHPSILHQVVTDCSLPCRVLQDESFQYKLYPNGSLENIKLAGYLEALERQSRLGKDCYRLEMMSLVFQIMLCVCGSYTGPGEAMAPRTRKDVAAVRDMLCCVAVRYGEKLNLSDVAEAGNVSRSKCCKLFAQYVGRSPMDYINCYRLDVAAWRLSNTESSIQSIAAGCGFPEQSYFTRLFKARYGITPGHCRKQLGLPSRASDE
ncbi:MAG: AraC family transcriptional regulator [Oscillospiraceae bacterium]|nr:AraC family transcriptional regulator [Oscillospiraceae bacterium]